MMRAKVFKMDSTPSEPVCYSRIGMVIERNMPLNRQEYKQI